MDSIHPEIEVTPDSQSLAEAGARHFFQLARAALATGWRFSVALSGGSTPQRLYSLLARPSYQAEIDWSRVFFFWGDERCVPPDHPDSNFNMANQALFSRAPVPPENIFRILGELGRDRAAEDYENRLKTFFAAATLPRLDLIFLGLGDDGHTASLFPGSPGVSERQRWAIGVEHKTPPLPLVDRVTLTPPVLNAAANVIFLVSGAGKAERVAQVLRGPHQPEILPAQAIRPAQGRLLWLLDRPAAAGLPDAKV